MFDKILEKNREQEDKLKSKVILESESDGRNIIHQGKLQFEIAQKKDINLKHIRRIFEIAQDRVGMILSHNHSTVVIPKIAIIRNVGDDVEDDEMDGINQSILSDEFVNYVSVVSNMPQDTVLSVLSQYIYLVLTYTLDGTPPNFWSTCYIRVARNGKTYVVMGSKMYKLMSVGKQIKVETHLGE